MASSGTLSVFFSDDLTVDLGEVANVMVMLCGGAKTYQQYYEHARARQDMIDIPLASRLVDAAFVDECGRRLMDAGVHRYVANHIDPVPLATIRDTLREQAIELLYHGDDETAMIIMQAVMRLKVEK